MPPAPEFSDRKRFVWRVEVLGEDEPEHQSETDRHVAVSRKIEVDLKGVGDRAIPRIDCREHARIERGVGDLAAGVGQQDLLAHAEHEERDPAGKFFQSVGAGLQLVGNLLKADDRSGDQLREHRDVAGVVNEIANHLGVAAVHVDHITHRLKSVETDPEGQNDTEETRELGRRNAHRRHECIVVLDPEIKILEKAEDREVADDRNGHEGFFLRREPFHQPPVGIVDRRVEEHQKAEIRVRPPVEKIAEEREDRVFPLARTGVVARQHRRQKEKQKQIT